MADRSKCPHHASHPSFHPGRLSPGRPPDPASAAGHAGLCQRFRHRGGAKGIDPEPDARIKRVRLRRGLADGRAGVVARSLDPEHPPRARHRHCHHQCPHGPHGSGAPALACGGTESPERGLRVLPHRCELADRDPLCRRGRPGCRSAAGFRLDVVAGLGPGDNPGLSGRCIRSANRTGSGSIS